MGLGTRSRVAARRFHARLLLTDAARTASADARWIAAAGAFVVSLDSMVNIAFPAIAAAFARPPDAMRWVIICYVLTYAFTSFAAGAAADRIGHGPVFSCGLALSAGAFVIAASAVSFGWLLAGRVLQGVGGGMIYGTAPGIVTLAATASTRGAALGFFNAAIGVAFTIGPIAAGALVEWWGWRTVFATRFPVAVLVLAWAWYGLPRRAASVTYRRIAVRDLARLPVLQACALAFVANAGIFAIWLLAPFYLVQYRGYDALTGGLLFMLTPVGTALAAPIAGRLADRIGRRGPSIVGLALEAAALLALSAATRATPAAVLAVALFIAGVGLGLFQVPNMAIVMGAFSAGQQGAAGGLAFMARTLGVVAGVATLSQIFASRVSSGFEVGFATAFVVAGLAVGAAAGASLFKA